MADNLESPRDPKLITHNLMAQRPLLGRSVILPFRIAYVKQM